MTGTRSSAPGHVDASTATPLRAAAGQLAAILVAGLFLRLTIAYLLPGSGFANDLGAFTAWARNLATEGPFGGRKASGQGHESGAEGLDEYLEKKLVTIGGL